MKDKPVVALDMDEVLFNFAQGYINWREERGMSPVSLHQMTGYQFYLSLGMSAAEANSHEAEFLQDVGVGFKPIDGAVEGVAELSKGNDLVLLTARVESIHGEITRKWIRNYFPDVFSKVILTHPTPETSNGSKGGYATKLGARVLVDDFAGHLETITSPTRGVLFGTHPVTSLGPLPDNCVRVTSWSELPRTVQCLTEDKLLPVRASL